MNSVKNKSLLVFRLLPDEDLFESIISKVMSQEEGFRSFAIITCVGSLKECKVRLAGATPTNQNVKVFPGPLEIVSLVGTISSNKAHIHISVSNDQGSTFGGHLMPGSRIDTTAEIALINTETLGGVKLTREMDSQTGFNELTVKPI